jgi:phage-related protein
MTQQEWEIKFYEQHNGQRPAEEFLDSLTHAEYARVDRKIGRLKNFGPKLDRPDAGYLRDKIRELRAHCRRVHLRIFYWRDGHKFILSHGLKKKSNRVPDAEIDKAVARRKDYFARKGEGSR